MTRITVDDELRQKLRNFTENIELCDADGNILARVQLSTPFTDPDQWVELTPPLSDEEWRRARDSDEPGISTEELKAHLRNL